MEHKNVLWEKEEGGLKLDDFVVLEYKIELPQLTGLGCGGRRIETYYAHFGEKLKERWRGQCYVLACLDYAQRQTEGREFIPWRGSLTAAGCQLEEDVLTISTVYRESRGRKGEEKEMNDRWMLPWGCPISEKNIKKHTQKNKFNKLQICY